MNMEWLKNSFKKRFYPITHAKAVIYDDSTIENTIDNVKKQLSQLAPAGAEVGQIFVIKEKLENGGYIMEPVDMPHNAEEDVQIGGTSIVQGGVANIPKANQGELGVVGTGGSVEIVKGVISLVNTSAYRIALRPYQYTRTGITTDTLDLAVKAAMSDGIGPAWTDEEQAAAQERMGILSSDDVLFG